jgi:hypothetical protein
MRYLGPVLGMTVIAAAFGGWVIALAPDFDDTTGAATQPAALPPDVDPAAIERAALSAFKQFAKLQSGFDMAYLSYYHEDAAIHLRRLLPQGGTDTLEFRRGNWAGLQQQRYANSAGGVAEAGGPAYSQLHTHVEGSLVIIEAKRWVAAENHTGPYKVALVRTDAGDWKIIEEWIESAM